jgi:hypothetical protein
VLGLLTAIVCARRMYPLCEVGGHSVAHPGYPVSAMSTLIPIAPYVQAVTLAARAGFLAGKLDALPVPRNPLLPEAPEVSYFDALLGHLDAIVETLPPPSEELLSSSHLDALQFSLARVCCDLEDCDAIDPFPELKLASYEELSRLLPVSDDPSTVVGAMKALFGVPAGKPCVVSCLKKCVCVCLCVFVGPQIRRLS